MPIIGSELENLYQVDKGIFRSEQTDDEAFEELSKFGIAEVLNLREYHTDNSEAKGLPLKLNQLRMETGSVSEAEIVAHFPLFRTDRVRSWFIAGTARIEPAPPLLHTASFFRIGLKTRHWMK